ncbi:MAG: HU family DNA-binding protein, partial [Clostridia bacterium]|nr:HU family DNA-binding protein [Clostridia bacterium]
MNKTELIAAVAEQAALSKKDADKAVSAVFAAITNALAEGDKVQLV